MKNIKNNKRYRSLEEQGNEWYFDNSDPLQDTINASYGYHSSNNHAGISADPTRNPFRPRMGGRPGAPVGKGPVTGVPRSVQRARARPLNQRRHAKMSLADIIGVGPLQASVGGNQSFNAAVSYGKQSKMLAPRISGRSANTVRIKHRELVEPALLGSTTFSLQETYVVNPGLSSSFPWLSGMASTWQEYELHALRYEFLTRVSTATAGSIMMSPDLDPTNPPPNNEISTSNNPSTVEGPVWHDLICNVNLKGSKAVSKRFVRTGPEVGDAHLFDALTMYIITSDCANSNPIGKIWVEYDVSFYLPVVTPSDPISRGCSMFVNTAAQILTITIPQAVLFGTAVCNPFEISYNGGGFTPPRGMYIIHVKVTFYDGVGSDCFLTLNKNGSALAVPSPSRTAVAANAMCGTFHCVSCDGNDIIDVIVTTTSTTTQVNGSGEAAIIFTLC